MHAVPCKSRLATMQLLNVRLLALQSLSILPCPARLLHSSRLSRKSCRLDHHSIHWDNGRILNRRCSRAGRCRLLTNRPWGHLVARRSHPTAKNANVSWRRTASTLGAQVRKSTPNHMRIWRRANLRRNPALMSRSQPAASLASPSAVANSCDA